MENEHVRQIIRLSPKYGRTISVKQMAITVEFTAEFLIIWMSARNCDKMLHVSLMAVKSASAAADCLLWCSRYLTDISSSSFAFSGSGQAAFRGSLQRNVAQTFDCG